MEEEWDDRTSWLWALDGSNLPSEVQALWLLNACSEASECFVRLRAHRVYHLQGEHTMYMVRIRLN